MKIALVQLQHLQLVMMNMPIVMNIGQLEKSLIQLEQLELSQFRVLLDMYWPMK
jgi:hypothetical protein